MIRDSVALKRLILAKRSHTERFAIAIALIAAATLLRWVIDQGRLGVPFSTYFPAVLIAAILLDWRYALFVTIACTLVINEVFMGSGWFSTFDAPRLALFGLFAFSSGLLVLTGVTVRRLLADINDLMDDQSRFNVELQHRIKNSLAIVQAMASQGARASDPAEFYRNLSGRIGALAKANELLSVGSKQDCRLPVLASEAVAPFRDDSRMRLRGPACTVPKLSCVPIVMALHELCTNAMKHGALSVPDGHVDLEWRIESTEEGPMLVIEWRETGGPEVAPPTHRGLGSRLLIPQKGIADVVLAFPEEGVTCRMTVQNVSHHPE